MQDFEKLRIWQAAYEMSIRIYRLSKLLPKEERYSMCLQIQRAASSIHVNLAEGCGRNSSAELAHFVQMAIASSNELDCFLRMAGDLGYIEQSMAASAREEVKSIRKGMIAFQKRVWERLPPKQAARKALYRAQLYP